MKLKRTGVVRSLWGIAMSGMLFAVVWTGQHSLDEGGSTAAMEGTIDSDKNTMVQACASDGPQWFESARLPVQLDVKRTGEKADEVFVQNQAAADKADDEASAPQESETAENEAQPQPSGQSAEPEAESSSAKTHRYTAVQNAITDEELELLAKIVWIESRGEPDEGQQGVVEVVFNRVLNSRFPNSIHDVIYQRGQFTSVYYLDTARPTQREYDNIALVLQGKTDVLSDDVVYFSREPLNDRIDTKICCHYFCRI
ncbi:cell wall hydrolase [Candidatus Soleaferrea massiliensis]|uniref:cell wall hydrolase n=1 Tax=Candidatus Soleaferrea massiliensis TaxID=1470354 RepID=UPI000693A402|nr:cell wall hydrolase [Candidatus Soleaferrea massiliensis]